MRLVVDNGRNLKIPGHEEHDHDYCERCQRTAQANISLRTMLQSLSAKIERLERRNSGGVA